MSGKLIIIEGSDGSGKQTQAERLYSRLKAEDYRVQKVDYPDYQSESSALIRMYLGGQFGNDPDAVNAYAASAFYAVDRYASYKRKWQEFYYNGGIVIADRYTTSNMVYQAVKLVSQQEKESFLQWLWDLEFNKFALPVPDAVYFLDMPPAYFRRLIDERAGKTAGKQDIHECNQDYLVNCYNSYHNIAAKYGWHKINCVNGELLKSIDEIHAEVYKSVMDTVINR